MLLWITCLNPSRRRPALTSSDLSYLSDVAPKPGLELGRKYKHAPIVEAIIEFRVRTREDLALTTLSNLALGDGFHAPEPIYQFAAQIGFDETGGPSTQVEHQGSTGFAYAHENTDTVQVTPEAFTYSWRHEYGEWTDFIAAAEKAWFVYRDVVRPEAVVSIGVRFVNILPMPPKAVEITDYLRVGISIPSALPQTIASLFAQVDIPSVDGHGTSATITTASAGVAPKWPHGGLVLDIDVKGPVQLSTDDPEFDHKITGKLDTFRFAKNLVFEACITDATRGLID